MDREEAISSAVHAPDRTTRFSRAGLMDREEESEPERVVERLALLQ